MKSTLEKAYSTKDLKTQIRSGQFAWPGGYPLYFLTSEGDTLSFEAVRENFATIVSAMRSRSNDGWCIIACAVNWEDSSLLCSHTSKRIESAYAEENHGI